MKYLCVKTCCFILLISSTLMTVAGGAPQVEFTDSTDEVEVYDFVEITIRVRNSSVANPFADGSACCLGKRGNLYILYFREGGRATVRLGDGCYRGKWYNPRSGQWEGVCQVSGPIWTTGATPDEEDWILWLEKDDVLKDTVAPGVVSVVTGGEGRKILVEFDEVRVFGSKTDGTGALSIEQIRAIQKNDK